MNTEETENFTEFLEESREPIDEEVINDNEEVISIENLQGNEILCCPYTGYIPRKHCKDKLKAITNHIKKHNPEKLNEFLNNNNISIESNTSKVNDTPIEVINNIYNTTPIVEAGDEDEMKLKLVQDIDILKMKFPNIYTCPAYSYPESSVDHLKRIRGNYSRMISETLSTKMVFGSIVALAKGAERVTDQFNICDLDGYANNLVDNQEELTTIIQELIDTNVLDMSCITPEMKLVICLLNIGVRTADHNRKKNTNIINIYRLFKKIAIVMVILYLIIYIYI